MTQALTVTITGADDGIDPKSICDLGAEFAFVEWGILYSVNRAGEPRYPSAHWLREFAKLVDWQRGIRGLPQMSLHLCGAAARQVLSGDILPLKMFLAALPFYRVQLNGYTYPLSLSFLEAAARRADIEFILQEREQTGDSTRATASDAKAIGRSSILFDASGGRGVSCIHTWREIGAPDGVRFGLAGGIHPLNVVKAIETARAIGASWIDMESGVRTDDRFDLVKVRSVLEQAAEARRRT